MPPACRPAMESLSSGCCVNNTHTVLIYKEAAVSPQTSAPSCTSGPGHTFTGIFLDVVSVQMNVVLSPSVRVDLNILSVSARPFVHPDGGSCEYLDPGRCFF